jgi:hypothetical protein
MTDIIPAGWFAWLAENLMRASATAENPDTSQWTVTPLQDHNRQIGWPGAIFAVS